MVQPKNISILPKLLPNYLLLLLILIVSCATIPAPKSGFKITFHNNTGELACYNLYWIDHGFNQPYPAAMAGGELKPGKDHVVDNGYRYGRWYVRWFSCRGGDFSTERALNITDDIHDIISTPAEDVMR